MLTPLVALAAAHAIEDLAEGRLGPSRPVPLRVGIKWPNDLFGASGKLGGILAQVVDTAVVLGVGINLTQEQGDFPPELRGEASSLEIEGVEEVPAAFSRILEELRAIYVLGYYPDKRGSGRWRKVAVRVSRPGVRVRTQSGYLDW